jgi:hypothetical protein
LRFPEEASMGDHDVDDDDEVDALGIPVFAKDVKRSLHSRESVWIAEEGKGEVPKMV